MRSVLLSLMLLLFGLDPGELTLHRIISPAQERSEIGTTISAYASVSTASVLANGFRTIIQKLIKVSPLPRVFRLRPSVSLLLLLLRTRVHDATAPVAILRSHRMPRRMSRHLT